MHKRVRTSFRVNSKGMLIPELPYESSIAISADIVEEENDSSDHPHVITSQNEINGEESQEG
jgi:hypothetical protein